MDIDFRYMRIYITERCNAKCKNCFNANHRNNSEMQISDFIALCEYLRNNKITQVKIMGGEPSVHKNFSEIIRVAQKSFSRVTIFTNGLLIDKICDIKLRDNDAIVYNFNFSKVFHESTLLLSQAGYRSLEVQIKTDSVIDEICSELLRIYNLAGSRSIGISFTLDCTSNILVNKKSLIPKIKALVEFANKNNFPFSFDHAIPFCFLYETGLNIGNNSFCRLYDTGLIDADLNLRMCNQFPEKLINVKNNNGFIPWSILCNYIKEAYYENQNNCLNKICKQCVFFDQICNGGCWMGKDYISAEDVFMFSGFPVTRNE